MDLAADEQRMAQIANDLADALEAALPRWLEREMRARAAAERIEVASAARARIAAVAADIAAELGPRLRRVLLADVDAGAGSPLAVMRAGVAPASDLLAQLGVSGGRRDDFMRERYPDDPYGLGPVTFADVDPALHDLGLRWGAARAHVHLTRRREGGS